MYKLAKLNVICQKITDGSHYSPKGTSEGYPMLSVKDMNNSGFSYDDCKWISLDEYEKLVKSDCKPLLNDVLIAKDGSYLKHVFVIKKEIEQAILSSIGILRPNLNKVDPDYLKYYLSAESVKIEVAKKYVSGSALPRIILKNFGEIEIIYRDLQTQKQIAQVLSCIDTKINLNNRINTELEGMAKLLYDYWFVQFDFPANMQDSSLSGAEGYKSSGGKMIYNQDLKREIPVGWEVKKFGDYSKVKSGFAFKSSWWQPEGIPVVKIKDIQEDYTLNQNDFSFVTVDKIEPAKRFRSKSGDLVIAMTGATIGKFAMIPYSDNPLLINQRVGLYELGEEPFEKLPFLLNSMKQEFFRGMVVQIAGGAAQPNISGEQLDSFPLIQPNNNLIDEFNEKFKPLYKKISSNIAENQKLASLRDWLLPMLMNGQVTIKEAEEKVNNFGMVAEPATEYKTNQ